jgi:hypothetical protein
MNMHVTRSASSFRSLFDPPIWSIVCDIRQWYSGPVQQKSIPQTVDGIVQRFVFGARRVESTHNAIETYKGVSLRLLSTASQPSLRIKLRGVGMGTELCLCESSRVSMY